MTTSHVVLANSYRPPSRTARRIRAVDPRTRVEVTVTVRGPALPSPDLVMAQALTPDELARQYGAQAQADQVAGVLRGLGLSVDAVTQAGRSLHVSGPASAFEAAFQPNLGIYEDANRGRFRGREGDLHIPAELDGLITGVLGLDQRRVARRKAAAKAPALAPQTPADLEQRYQFPPGTAKGQIIAIAEFGQTLDDGSVIPPVYLPEEVDAFCKSHQRPLPNIQVVPVNLAPLTLNDFQDLPPDQRSIATDEAVEVMMDVQIAASLCPEATLLVLFASFDQKGWVDMLDAVTSGVHGVPVALSISWGLAEDSPDWSSGAVAAISERLQLAAMLGITICASSGDDGASDGIADAAGHVDFPGSSPFALCVGGTQLAEAHGAVEEVAWWEPPGCRTPSGGGASGGGVSARFARPAWQAVTVASINAGSIDGRVVPDVGALAGAPYYDLRFAGKTAPNGGTSASTPLWASLIARINAALPPARRQRFLTPLLYGKQPGDQAPLAAAGCRPIVTGHNASYPSPGSGYKCQAGYSAVTGWGAPNGMALLEQLRR